MTEQEKELRLILVNSGFFDVFDETWKTKTGQFHEGDIGLIIKDIIQRYPQILAEKVWEGNDKDFLKYVSNGTYADRYHGNLVEVYIREVIS